MGIVTDSDGQPYIQEHGDKEKWPYPGLYLSTTAYLVAGYGKYDARHYVDSAKVPFAVVPGNVRTSIPPKFLGCKSIITDMKTDKELECACCDVGPSSHLGEASMAAASISASPQPEERRLKRPHPMALPNVSGDALEGFSATMRDVSGGYFLFMLNRFGGIELKTDRRACDFFRETSSGK